MNAFNLVERHHGVQLLCHAIRHLLDHTPDEADSGDAGAIDLLQWAINPPENNPHYAARAQLAKANSFPIPVSPRATVQSCASGESDGIVGEIACDCPRAEPENRTHPVSLLSLLELLLHAVHARVLGRSRPVSHESPLGSAR